MSTKDKDFNQEAEFTANNTQNNKSASEKEEKNLQIGDIISKTEFFIEKNKKTLVAVISAIVLLVIIFCLYQFWYMPKQEKQAENEMFVAEAYFRNNDYTKALNGDGKHMGLLAISDDYSSTSHGKLASFYVGRIYLEQGKFQDAITYFKKFNPKDAFMSSQTKALIGDCYWELNDLDKAISHYNDAVKTKPNDFTTPDILMKLAAAYEVKKDFNKALECYKTIKTEYPRSMEFQQIDKYISRTETLISK